jgi:hypothetical protein
MSETKSLVLEKSEIYNRVLENYLQNDNLKNLLLLGPPGSNTHHVNMDKANIWVDQQTSRERKIPIPIVKRFFLLRDMIIY